MPPNLLNKLSLKRDVDHKIELLQNFIALIHDPYWMAQKELDEFHKKLNERLFFITLQGHY